jgi:probable F420-dependent oxidoreductase
MIEDEMDRVDVTTSAFRGSGAGRGAGQRMKLGIGLPHFGPMLTDAASLRRFAARAEELGYGSLWAGDRLFTPLRPKSAYPGDDYSFYLERVGRNADPLTVVATAAAVTSHIRFNFSTLNAPLHEPVQLARALTTLDFLSDGRLGVGFGLSWVRDEYDALGLEWANRGRRLDDILSFLDAWWTTNPVTFESRTLSLPAAQVALRPVQPGGPPVWLGGASEAALRRVGRRASGWLAFDTLPTELAASLWEVARRSADAAGRDPDALERSVRVNVEPGEQVDRIIERLDEVAASGADEAVVEFSLALSTVDEALELAQEVIQKRGG